MQDRRNESCWAVLLLGAALLWLGMVIGVSIIATPAKFLAPSLSLPVALDVGRHTFAIFNKIELLSAIVLIFLGAMAMRTLPGLIVIGLACAVVLAETFWLLPVLDLRVEQIIGGQMPPASNLHTLYVVFELVKLGALAIVIIAMARKLVSASAVRSAA